MRKFSPGAVLACAVVVMAMPWIAAPAKAAEVYPGCAAPPASYHHAWLANPSTLASVLPKANGGDVIYLTDGDYGRVHLNGINSAFVTLVAAKGQTPMFSALTIRGSHWAVRGITVVGLSPPGLFGKWRAHLPLVRIDGGDNFILDNNTIASRLGDYPWAEESPGNPDQAAVSDGILANQSACVSIVGNHLSNVFNGMRLAGDQAGDHGRFYLVTGNTIDDFAGDGIDHSISDALIAHNTITNAHDICHGHCIHMDGIQGWNYNDRLGILNHDVVIDGNRIVVQARPSLIFPADALQGITIFDGYWKDVKVINNIVLTDVWHGITIAGVDGLLIANNTVLATTNRKTWILVGGRTHEGGVSENVIVANNIATSIQTARTRSPPAHMKLDRNLQTAEPEALFVAFDVAHLRYNLRLKPRGRAVGKADPKYAPKLDIDGQPRYPPISPGAYR
ncbi:MAG: hypothetical protein ACREEB_07400 [Caulobacteraceae bacterium]